MSHSKATTGYTRCTHESMHWEKGSEGCRTCCICTIYQNLEAAVSSLCEVVCWRQHQFKLDLQHQDSVYR